MVDRQDIDALLVGALYGELTPAEQARLQSHLESHPADRAALDDLKSARQAVKESRIFEHHAEPPQAISALLLQEAHRRAPKVRDEKEGWFARFVRTFAMHPAMAAAATLVLVVGVAGVLYSRGGGDAAEKTATAPAGETAKADETKANLPSPPAAGPSAGSAFEADVVAQQQAMAKQEQALTKGDAPAVASTTPRAEYKKQAPAHHSVDGIVANRPEPQPKELERGKLAAQKPSDDQVAEGSIATDTTVNGRDRGLVGAATSSRASGGAAGGPGNASNTGNYARPQQPAPAPVAQASPPPPPPKTSAAPQQAPAKPTATVAKKVPAQDESVVADKAKDAKPDQLAWAKSMHQRAVDLASNNCDEASKIALTIQRNAPDYFNAYVATDRKLKGCLTYIQNAQERENEKTSKARSQKSRDMAPTEAK